MEGSRRRGRRRKQLLVWFNEGKKNSEGEAVAENCSLLGYYAAISGNFLPTFRDNLRRKK